MTKLYMKKRVLLFLPVACIALLLAACNTGIPSQGMTLGAQSGPSLHEGTTAVTLTHTPTGTTLLEWNATTHDLRVYVSMTGLAPKSVHPAHIHQGNCDANGPVKYQLNKLIADATGNANATTTIPHVENGIPGSGWSINVHNGPGLSPADQFTPVACVNILNPRMPAHHDQRIKLSLGKTNAANQSASGKAVLSLSDGTLTVRLDMHGLVPHSQHAAHIHVGSCAMQGAIIYPLKTVTADAHGNSVSETVIPHVQALPAHRWYVNVHYSTDLSTQTGLDPIACGDITSA